MQDHDQMPVPPPAMSTPSRLVWLLVLAAVLAMSWMVFKTFFASSGIEIAPPWISDAQAARAEAMTSGKPVLAYFTASWCPPCQDFKQRVLTDQSVQAKLPQRVVPLMVDVDAPGNAGPLIGKLNVEGIPAFYVLDPADDSVIARYAHDPRNLQATATFLDFLDYLPRVIEAQKLQTQPSGEAD